MLGVAEAEKRYDDDLLDQIAYAVTRDINNMSMVVPRHAIGSLDIKINEETTAGSVGYPGVGGATASDVFTGASVVTTRTFSIVPHVGIIEIPRTLMRTSKSAVVYDQEVNSKMRRMANRFWNNFFNGQGTANTFKGLSHADIIGSGQTIEGPAAGQALDFGLLDDLALKVKSANGVLDAYITSPVGVKRIKQLGQGQSGAGLVESMDQSDGISAPISYAGVPVWASDHISATETISGADNTGTTIYAVNWEQELGQGRGVCAIVADLATDMSISETELDFASDVEKTHVSWDAGMANFNSVGAAKATRVLAPA